MTTLWQDVRIAARALSKRKATTGIAVCTLALAIGANTAIFSLLNAVVLRSLPVPHPEQLVALATTIADSANGDQPFSLVMFKEMSQRQKIFSDLFAYDGGGLKTFEVDGRLITAALAEVSGTYYRAMGIGPLLGRFIEEGDVSLGIGMSSGVAVISYRAWRGWYHGDAKIIGKIIRIGDHHPFTIIGVEPEGFSGLIIDGSSDVTIPILSTPQRGGTDVRNPRILWLTLYARLKPGITVQQARAGLTLLWPHILEATPPPGYEGEKLARFYARRIALSPAANGVSFLRKRFSYSLEVLLGLVAAVLLIACLNLANLTLARAAAQRHETGVRSALGASAWKLIWPALVENLLLSGVGALLGLVLAYWASHVLLRIAWSGLVTTRLNPSLDLRVLAFTAAVTLVSGILFAAPPALHVARIDPIEALRQTRSVAGERRAVSGRVLLILQTALSLVLVTGALLFGRTLNRLHKADVGYRRDHLLTLMLFPQPGGRGTPTSTAYYQQLAERLKQLPGVESVSFSNSAPANELEDYDQVYDSLSGPPVQAVSDFVGPDFFHVMGMQLLVGREFSWHDDEHAPETAILSQSLAAKLFGNADPIGRTVYFGPHAHAFPLKIIGVANSASLWKVESFHPLAIYRSMAFLFFDAEPLLDIRTSVDPRSMKAEAERVVRGFGRHYSLRTMTAEERLDSYLSVQRLTALLAAFFGASALLISSIGLYGLMSWHVARRTAELGIRLALGAQREQVLSMVLREALALAAAGCILGLIASLLSAKFIRSMLFGVSTADPVILGIAVTTLLGVATIAALLPARRAASVDPIAALRVE
ncbi:MAG: ABC transporter permease [Acidobacteriaceae bacterium]|nr:ABC transporter permease [Acidobacteriaceae bacterium]